MHNGLSEILNIRHSTFDLINVPRHTVRFSWLITFQRDIRHRCKFWCNFYKVHNFFQFVKYQTFSKSVVQLKMSEKPILYMAVVSPGCRAVLMCAAELGIELEQKIMDIQASEHKKASYIQVSWTILHNLYQKNKILEYLRFFSSSNFFFLFLVYFSNSSYKLQLNPQQTIPLLNDNGVIVVDSHVICAYLCEKYAETDDLYPKDLAKRALCDSRLHFDSGHLFARMRFLYEPVIFMKSLEWADDRIQSVQTAWDILERFLENSAYVCGDEMTIADFCLVATATSMNEIVPLEAEKHLKIMEWIDRMAELPYYDEINGTPGKEFQAFVRATKEKNADEP